MTAIESHPLTKNAYPQLGELPLEDRCVLLVKKAHRNQFAKEVNKE